MLRMNIKNNTLIFSQKQTKKKKNNKNTSSKPKHTPLDR